MCTYLCSMKCIMHDIMFSLNDNILIIRMLWVTTPWCYTTLHCYLSRMKPLCWHIGFSAQSQWCHGRDGRHLESFCEILMNFVLSKQLHDAYEFFVMHMSYEMVLTMQLLHLICRKGRVQPPTRKGGWYLFQRTSDEIQDSLQ